jgi:hypothetical protein
MTIKIPDDLDRSLKGLPPRNKRALKQLALDSLRSIFDIASSPQGELRAIRELPH